MEAEAQGVEDVTGTGAGVGVGVGSLVHGVDAAVDEAVAVTDAEVEDEEDSSE